VVSKDKDENNVDVPIEKGRYELAKDVCVTFLMYLFEPLKDASR
jgi:hypothetical protein